MHKNWKKVTALSIATAMATMSLVGCSNTGADVASGDQGGTEPAELLNQTPQEDVPELEGYTLLWNDEFNGTEMDETIWSCEPREPGWTNNELQEYTNGENVSVRDGHLVIKADKIIKEDGSTYYTSGKVKTQNKKDFMYGRVETRAKVPEGKGLWPAIWMMPTDESYYGQWPKCGEIDIMEVLGDQTNLAYSTIHYGEPHAEQQGTLQLDNGSFADDFHTYAVDWNPGRILFMIDEKVVLTVYDWFTAVEGEDEKPYPAPFNQTFFVQMNLAVGGNWPGDPDENTNFDNAEFEIDYVRVYQRDEYNMDVKKPELKFREILEDGNHIHNGEFAEEALDDNDNWEFLLFNEGAGAAEIVDGVLHITSTAEGTEDYSVQIVQADLPQIKDKKYRVTFEAKASEDRQMKVAVTAPTAGWVRYLDDTALDLTTDWQTYTYEYEMTFKTDNNGRLEFNMGHQGSCADVFVRNVRLEEIE